jgi:hypothetical protein
MWLKTSLLIVFMVGSVVVYVWFQGQKELRNAEGAREKGDREAAITHYARSIKWYLPGAPHVTKAAEGLWAIGVAAEKNADRQTALIAYQELRSSFYAARSFYTPGKRWIEKCNERIAPLMAQWESETSTLKEKPTLEELRQKHMAILTQKERPDYFWSIVLEIGFFGWVGATIGFIMQVFQGEKRFVTRRAWAWGTLFLVSYFIWIVGMLKA